MTLHSTPKGAGVTPPLPFLQKPELQEQRENPYIYLLPYLLLNREHTDTNTTYGLARALNFPRGDFLQHGGGGFFPFPGVYAREKRELR